MPQERKTTIEAYPLEKKKVIKKTIAAYLGYLFLLNILILVHIFYWKLPYTILVVVVFLYVLAFFIQPIYQYYYYKKYFYDVGQDFLVIKKGVIMIREAILNYDKIQDVYMDQDLFDRIFRLWDVHFASAGTTAMELHIDGLNYQYAEGLRNLLIQRTSIRNKYR